MPKTQLDIPIKFILGDGQNVCEQDWWGKQKTSTLKGQDMKNI